MVCGNDDPPSALHTYCVPTDPENVNLYLPSDTNVIDPDATGVPSDSMTAHVGDSEFKNPDALENDACIV